MKKNYTCIILLPILIFYTGCVNLKEVNTFSRTSEKTAKSIDDIGYSFSRGSSGFELLEFYEGLTTGQKAMNKLSLPLIDPSTVTVVDSLGLKADAAINMISGALESYFEALNKISDKSLVNYNYDSLAEELENDSSIMKKLTLTNEQVDASSIIATVFTNTIMGRYKERIIKEAIINNDGYVGKVIDALCEILEKPLIFSINSDLGSLHDRYARFFADSLIDEKIKFDWIKDYDLEKNKLIKSREKANKIIAGLQAIKQGHHDLDKNLQTRKISSKEVKKLCNKYSGTIFNQYQQIKMITN